MPLRKTSLWVTTIALFSASHCLAEQASDRYLGLNPGQKAQLKSANQAKNDAVKPSKTDKDTVTQNLMSQVLANAGDPALQPLLTQIQGDIQTIDGAEENYWQTLGGFLTPTQVAKIYLKSHPPKNPAQTPPQKPANPQMSFNWNAYFGLGKDLKSQLKAADQQRSAQAKTTREEMETAVDQLNQLVQSNAADSAIQPTLSTILTDLHSQHSLEQTFWGATLPGFLSPTQTAKLYLHRHPPQGGFNPPAPSTVPSH